MDVFDINGSQLYIVLDHIKCAVLAQLLIRVDPDYLGNPF